MKISQFTVHTIQTYSHYGLYAHMAIIMSWIVTMAFVSFMTVNVMKR